MTPGMRENGGCLPVCSLSSLRLRDSSSMDCSSRRPILLVCRRLDFTHHENDWHAGAKALVYYLQDVPLNIVICSAILMVDKSQY
jgi:hypothetical protein